MLGNFSENHDNARFDFYPGDIHLSTNVVAFSVLGGEIPIICQVQEQRLSKATIFRIVKPCGRQRSPQSSSYNPTAFLNHTHYGLFSTPIYSATPCQLPYTLPPRVQLYIRTVVTSHYEKARLSASSRLCFPVGRSTVSRSRICCEFKSGRDVDVQISPVSKAGNHQV